MLVTVTNEQKPEVRWEFRQDPKSGRMAVKWLKDGTQDQIIAALQEALEEAKHQQLLISTITTEWSISSPRQCDCNLTVGIDTQRDGCSFDVHGCKKQAIDNQFAEILTQRKWEDSKFTG